ncbi:MAG TPA: hypothetical protein VFN67_30250 [Polyangiales bacterium]|nr:hypothetical protein [Polyangiales bacterium]
MQFLVGQPTAANSQPESSSASQAPRVRKPPLYLEVQASLRGKTRGPFVPDITLHPGAQIALRARTSIAAHVYMLHCDASSQLSVFPDAGGIGFRADQWVSLPAAGMPIQLGAETGTETVFVMATREPLAHADARLERWLTDHLREPQTARCDAELESALAGPPLTAATTSPARKLPYALRGVDTSPANGQVARAFAQSDGIVILRLSYKNAPQP